MQLQKISGGKTVLEQPAKNTPTARPVVPAAASLKQVGISRPITSLIAAAGLPADRLSASIISFARFFSLPLKPELMAEIRRQAFIQPAATENTDLSAKPQETADSTRMALSLAASAAESKGVELQPKVLEAFAEAIDPDSQNRQNPDGHDQKERNPREQRQDNDQGQNITPGSLEKKALESMEKDSLLAILNSLPGKNGQRWIVLPFDFCENGRSFRVSLRVMLDAPNDNMTLDIVDGGEASSGAKPRRWLFVLNAANGRINQLTACLQPELSAKAQSLFVNELAKLLEIEPERVCVKSWTGPFPFESGWGDELPAVDEAV